MELEAFHTVSALASLSRVADLFIDVPVLTTSSSAVAGGNAPQCASKGLALLQTHRDPSPCPCVQCAHVHVTDGSSIHYGDRFALHNHFICWPIYGKILLLLSTDLTFKEVARLKSKIRS